MPWSVEGFLLMILRYHRTANEKARGGALLASVFQKRLPPEAVDLLTVVSVVGLQLEACTHPFFDELRDPNTRLPNGRPLPPLFNFKPQATKQGQWGGCPTSLCPLFENVGVTYFSFLTTHEGWGL
ncbi:hypothetical protein CsSME_00036062 [Camellia sinensis var. sinensis]